MKIKQKQQSLYRHEIEQLLGGGDASVKSAKDVLDLLYGDYNNDYRSDYKIVRRFNKPNRNFKCRLNMLWATPLTILMFPVLYVVKGYGGWSEESLIGRFILKATGYMEK